MVNEIYCGIEDVPKGSRRGSMKDCAEKKQIRYWGLHKIDPRTIEGGKKTSKSKDTRYKLGQAYIKAKVRTEKLKDKVKYEKDKAKKKEYEKELKVMMKTLVDAVNKFNKFEDDRKREEAVAKARIEERKASAKKASKASAKKTTAKKTTAKKTTTKKAPSKNTSKRVKKGSSKK